MKVNRKENHLLIDTLKEVERLAKTYASDMRFLKNKNIYQVFDFIAKSVKYEKDPIGIELVMRPKLTLKRNCGDCDDKTVLFLAWMILKGYPCGYSIVQDKYNKTYHHIFPFIYCVRRGIIKDLDATYAHNKIGISKDWVKRKNFFVRYKNASNSRGLFRVRRPW